MNRYERKQRDKELDRRKRVKSNSRKPKMQPHKKSKFKY